jgi:hypothetical protein
MIRVEGPLRGNTDSAGISESMTVDTQPGVCQEFGCPQTLREPHAGRMSTIATPYPEEFSRDVVAVARKSEARLGQIARTSRSPTPRPANWLKAADVEDCVRPGMT